MVLEERECEKGGLSAFSMHYNICLFFEKFLDSDRPCVGYFTCCQM